MTRLFLTDPITKKKSVTDYKLSLVILFAMTLFLACYQQKRVKINFTGLEIKNEKN